jgi:16S rRNA (guanine(966)-N(2))-methyltransferase RsmD
MNQGSAREREIINPNRLRILGGSAKGKKIDSPDVYLRPMMGKVKEALYSALTHIGLFGPNGAGSGNSNSNNTTRVLDMFAGSGSVGLEALSRGAQHAMFVDLAEACTSTALRNADNCGFAGRAGAVCARAEDVLRDPVKWGVSPQQLPFGLITLTPPYEEVIYQELIDALCNSPCVGEDTVVAIEYPVEMGALPYILGGDQFFGLRNRKYGRTVLALYVYRPTRRYDQRPDEFA